MIKIGILASHNGTGFDALHNACEQNLLNAQIAVVISNNSNALVLQKAQNSNIPNFVINSKNYPLEDIDQSILKKLIEYKCDFIFLSGYMKKIDLSIIRKYEKRIFNAHPALLPKFGGAGMYGRYVHEAVIEANEIKSGVTIHEVNAHYDEGEIILQKELTILKNETVESLESRIKELEKVAIVEAFQKILEKK